MAKYTDKTIHIDTFDKVGHLVNTAMAQTPEMDILSGKYTVNAKSLMGVLSLNITKPVTLRIHAEDIDAERILSIISDLIVE